MPSETRIRFQTALFCPANGKALPGQFVGDALQKGEAFGKCRPGFGGGFEGAAGFGAVGAVVEAALPDKVAEIGEIARQIGGLEVV